MSSLDVELEVLQKQMQAALRLSEDKSLAKNIRRKHRRTYRDTHHKVNFITIVNGTRSSSQTAALGDYSSGIGLTI